MDFNKFNNLASGIKAIVVSIAVIIGGVWVLYTFISLQNIGKAKAELVALERKLKERGTLNIEFNIKTLKTKKEGSYENFDYFMYVKIKVKNIGNRVEVIDWQTTKLIVQKVSIDQNGHLYYDTASIIKYKESEYVNIDGLLNRYSTIYPDEIKSYSFLAPVKSQGIHYLNFKAITSYPTSIDQQSDLHNAGIEDYCIFTWESSSYYNVE